MKHGTLLATAVLLTATMLTAGAGPARADGDLRKVKHVVVIVQENHSFDNYFGTLPYAPGSIYHSCSADHSRNDHRCVSGLDCTKNFDGSLNCTNSNPDLEGNTVVIYHQPNACSFSPDHDWHAAHHDGNWFHPADTIFYSPNDGFVRWNEPSDPTNTTMSYYTQDDLPFYYDLAQEFAIDDNYHASVPGPTFPNRAYIYAATSFGHLTTSETLPPIPQGYLPITGDIMDLLDKYNVPWTDYYSEVPSTGYFRPFLSPHLVTIDQFAVDAAAGALPPVSWVEANFGVISPRAEESDEDPPADIRAGPYFVSQVLNAVRNGPDWKSTVVFITYDENGGFYDHVPLHEAPQAHAFNPDGIEPGQCADLSDPPQSEQPGGGIQCTVSQENAAAICPGFTSTGPYPPTCAHFNQLGFRVPIMVVSPFSKPHYVSHTLGDHTSILAFIEKRFMTKSGRAPSHPALTLRDANADTLEDLFDFSASPSKNAELPATPPQPSPSDPGCPFPE
ncbi:MAG TPA: alkaline phosphatase family protein [Candidatus Binataceae bacterium]|nr:alkaline phosphatase family protein [Candidatus Binataceae bacterium]